jgi:NitT/TauT family transport system ATP-binding protein
MLEAVRISKRFEGGGRTTEAVGEVSLSVGEAELAAIVGPSGCGKTTLLRCLAGLLPVSSGEIKLDGERLTSTPDRLGVVFQDYSRSLFPWLSVRRNVMLPLRRSESSQRERRAHAQGALEEVGLGRFADHYPWQLSGGMQQRAAIARAIASRPRLLLLDEPFASVDAQTRAELQDLILKIQRERGMTAIFVTHDIDEAIYLSNRIHVLGPAPARVIRVLEIDLPAERDQVTTKADPAFPRLRAILWDLLREPSDQPASGPARAG